LSAASADALWMDAAAMTTKVTTVAVMNFMFGTPGDSVLPLI
jgi:hypothetical protein